MIVVSNTTPIIGLSILNRIDLLRDLFGEIHIPRTVFDELTADGANRYGGQEVSAGVSAGWVLVENVPTSSVLTALKTDLDEGEADAIALALERQADLVLIDERKGRAKAKVLGLKITGTIGGFIVCSCKGIQIQFAVGIRAAKSSRLQNQRRPIQSHHERECAGLADVVLESGG